MGKPKYELPSATFPYKISKRLCLLSVPRRVIVDTGEGMPMVSSTGVRKSALRAQISDRINEAAYPYIRRLVLTRRSYKSKFPQDRLEKLDRLIESVNTTMYTKLANAAIDLRKQLPGAEAPKDSKKKRGWSESDWKKHMDYINQISGPKPEFEPPPLSRGQTKPLTEMIQRINVMSQCPEHKMYRRMSQEDWYRDPIKVPKSALTYQITDSMKKLATPRAVPAAD